MTSDQHQKANDLSKEIYVLQTSIDVLKQESECNSALRLLGHDATAIPPKHRQSIIKLLTKHLTSDLIKAAKTYAEL